ncbi:rRNA methyltransferase [Francisella tularensis]|uniref:rRNA methyltransferase n=1 Tax=Francisella tularensis subsp. holarctica TaxID=119857 RepID=A0A6B2JH88_FRATU|nr:rRNA methyltransferase [Francisella tularensis]NDR69112.1 rRNA methyltransferase [Francisella tularensis subsp. holarctica]NDR89685.1 rRNA methyltransferase [Francisella tularensis subsp. holarctica]NDS18475.1 rRNA methyltransferase [Francisella tularensis subsp. holarctica]NDS34948.1 rRNA methyltransferase [Francisella tularensis subsp. holarctica]NDS36475.1 rRNA methyltransferase [Francisella tularensis subsp. holarctica]
MMAFLLDIITFLQISFSTNIFRINYTKTTIIKFLYKHCFKN